MAGASPAARIGPRWPAGSARRPPTPGTTPWRPSGSRQGGTLVRGWADTAPGEVGGGPGPRGAAGRGPQHRHPAWVPPDHRAWPVRRSGPTADAVETERPRVAGRARRGGHRCRAGPGVRPLRARGHHRRDGSPAAGARRSPRPALLAGVFAGEGIEVSTGASGAVASRRAAFAVRCRRRRVTGGAAVCGHRATARPGRPRCGAIGIDESARSIPVDDHLRVAPGVWAIGDITGKGAFTHVSMYQAAIVVDDILGEEGPGRLPGPAPGHLHRPRDRIGRAERGGGPGAGLTAGRLDRSRRRPGAGSTRPATTASSSWWRTPSAACWWGRRRPDRWAARCSAC